MGRSIMIICSADSALIITLPSSTYYMCLANVNECLRRHIAFSISQIKYQKNDRKKTGSQKQ